MNRERISEYFDYKKQQLGETIHDSIPWSYENIAAKFTHIAEYQLKRLLAGRLYPQKKFFGADAMHMPAVKGTLLRAGSSGGPYDWYFLPNIPEFHGKPYVFQIAASGADDLWGDACHDRHLPLCEWYELTPKNYLLTQFPAAAFGHIINEWPAATIQYLVESWSVDKYVNQSDSFEVISSISGNPEARKHPLSSWFQSQLVHSLR